MKKHIVKAILPCLVVMQLFACTAPQEKTEAVVIDKEQIKKEIQAREDSFAALYNASEVKDIGYYAEDATTFFPNRAPLVGKQAIVEFLKADLVSNTNKISFTTNEVFPSSDGIQVVEIGNYKVSDSANNVLSTGNYMSLFEKRNGRYVCLRDMSASDMPLQ